MNLLGTIKLFHQIIHWRTLALLLLFEVSEVSLPEMSCYSQGWRKEERNAVSEHSGLKPNQTVLNKEITVRELILTDSREL